ncbi:glycosyltransferase family 4 protein [Microcoleus sp. FACHB-SPT15]|uniref:glycosyltransferase family 4 protein n=1 Tax=Microcoleus sp. FACHB-SPT15 TaxID=2692830 RepID=UPI00178210DF|nr:glycosyltransferase family 4 protein [Microcoleus sp. FACHB-SPT15]MBD1804007.1 glycosyltransferase family 4 protein [Microcoleus sp. FACHB-SPT15]
MKITFVLPFAGLAGGIRVAAIYAERLKKRGHEVFVVSLPPDPISPLQQVKSLLKGKGLLSNKEGSHFDGVDVPHRVLDRCRPITDADVPDADVVIATWWETAEWVAKMSEAKGAKAYFIQHHEIFEEMPKERVEATWSLPLHKITISKWLVELSQERYGDRNISFVPNSVDTDQFYAPPRGKQPIPTVGMLYAPIGWKGCEVSLKAFSLAAQKIPNLRLVAFGSSAPTADLPLPEGTQYIQRPAQNTIKDIYASCDVWLCGSWSEGFHLPPLEAMACRCPVVSTQVGGPLDIVKEGVNGYLVPLGDSTALANQLVHVLSLPETEWQTMSDAAYATATQYTWDDAVELFEAALHTAIDRQRRGDFSRVSAPKDVSPQQTPI